MASLKQMVKGDMVNCPICNLPYQEWCNQPRILFCGDTICEDCAEKACQDNTLTCSLCSFTHTFKVENYGHIIANDKFVRLTDP
jgi:hypothetical protein